MLRMEAEAERLRAEGGAEVRAKLKRAEDEVEGLKEQVRLDWHSSKRGGKYSFLKSPLKVEISQ